MQWEEQQEEEGGSVETYLQSCIWNGTELDRVEEADKHRITVVCSASGVAAVIPAACTAIGSR
ncbi:hypothetical protein E2C01_096329 [Portunus trituberculatus]|uniref:Uncharacterized protein n=1 Tax=Portunus trituberculatus TaxID=210409 RepID=A0A5B7K697_PORTR|nr:hypothetical protein [Portunus trituberculatus]